MMPAEGCIMLSTGTSPAALRRYLHDKEREMSRIAEHSLQHIEEQVRAV